MAETSTAPFSWQRTFAALRYRNYRLWFIGQLVSLMGSWMQGTAQGYLVFELTRSPAYLGYVAFAAGVPSWVFMLYGGVVADRVPRRTLLILTQSAMMVLAFVLAALAFLEMVRPWHILVLATLLGVANAFDAPARQSFVLEMVGREDLTNAIALNSTMFNAATAVGPAVAGLTYSFFGPGWCFAINGVSFIAVIAALMRMRFDKALPPARRNPALADLKEGLRYVAGHPNIRALVALVGMTTLFGFSFVTLIPAWAVKILGGDATTNGLMQSARGFGALLGALSIASLGRFRFRGKLLTTGTFAFPLMLLLFSTVRATPLALLVLVGAGAGLIITLNMANALVQLNTADELRGRVMGVYSLTFMGFMPIGSLLAGTVAEKLTEPLAVVLGASCSLLVAVCYWVFLPRLRRL